MTKNELNECLKFGEDVFFNYNGKKYSLTHYENGDKGIWLSFCEYYKDTLDVPTVDDLWDLMYQNERVSEIFSKISLNDVTVI